MFDVGVRGGVVVLGKPAVKQGPRWLRGP